MDEKAGRQEASNSDLAQVFCLEQEISALEQGIIEAKGKLENLQGELARTQLKKAEEITDAENKKASLLKEIVEQTKQKVELEKQCAELSARNEQTTNDLRQASQKLQDKNTRLQETEKQLEILRKEQKRLSRKGKTAAVVVLAISVIIMFAGWFYYTEELSELQYSCTRAERAAEESRARLGNIKELAGPVMIRVNGIYNTDKYTEVIGDLTADAMRYLSFDIDVFFVEDAVTDTTIYMDLYGPEGAMMQFDQNAGEHTASFVLNGSDNVRRGWGNAERSNYGVGIYRVDFLYGDAIIYSEKFEISSGIRLE